MGVVVTLKFRFVYRLKQHGVTHDDPSSSKFYNSLAYQHKVVMDQRPGAQNTDTRNLHVGVRTSSRGAAADKSSTDRICVRERRHAKSWAEHWVIPKRFARSRLC